MESKDSVTTTEVSSAASSQSPEKNVVVREATMPPSSLPPALTAGNSQRDFYDREVVIRGTDVKALSIQVNIEREEKMYRNIVANTGPRRVNTSATDEE